MAVNVILIVQYTESLILGMVVLGGGGSLKEVHWTVLERTLVQLSGDWLVLMRALLSGPNLDPTKTLLPV